MRGVGLDLDVEHRGEPTQALRAEDVRLDLAVAKCHSCNAVYDLSGRKARGVTVQPEAKPALRPKAALPPKFQVEEDGMATRIACSKPSRICLPTR